MSRTQARASTSGRGAARDGARGGNRIGRGAAPQITLAGTSRPAAAACACGGGCPRCAAPPAPSPGLLLQRQEEPETPTAPATSAMACRPTHHFPVGLGRVDITFPLGSAGPLSERDRRSLEGYAALWHDAQPGLLDPRPARLPATFRIDGFAESTEPAARQMPLSCERAQIAGEALQDRGIPATEIELYAHGGSDRFDPNSNRRAAVFIDVPEASGIGSAEQRQEVIDLHDAYHSWCTAAGTPAYSHTRSGHLVLDVGGEGCVPEANNVNPSTTRTSGVGMRGTPIPNHVCGVVQSIPIGNDTVDFLNVEGIPLTGAPYREIVRVIRPDGTICIRGAGEGAVDRMREALVPSGYEFEILGGDRAFSARLGGARNDRIPCPPRCLGRGKPPRGVVDFG